MPDANTANYNLTKPEVNASRDTWGTKTNANMDVLDTQIKNRSNEISTAVKNALAQVMAFGQGGPQLLLAGANLTLLPTHGSAMVVNDKLVTLPNAGVSLSPTGLAANTNYFIYAADVNNDSIVDTLEASTTILGFTTDIRLPIKNGDATRTFVGIARTTATTQWADTDAQRFVRSLYNRVPLKLLKVASPVVSKGATNSEVSTTCRVEFISFDEVIDVTGAAQVNTSTTGNNYVAMGISVDGIAPVYKPFLATNSANVMSLDSRAVADVGMGYHYATIFGNGGVSYSGVFNSTLLTGTVG